MNGRGYKRAADEDVLCVRKKLKIGVDVTVEDPGGVLVSNPTSIDGFTVNGPLLANGPFEVVAGQVITCAEITARPAGTLTLRSENNACQVLIANSQIVNSCQTTIQGPLIANDSFEVAAGQVMTCAEITARPSGTLTLRSENNACQVLIANSQIVNSCQTTIQGPLLVDGTVSVLNGNTVTGLTKDMVGLDQVDNQSAATTLTNSALTGVTTAENIIASSTAGTAALGSATNPFGPMFVSGDVTVGGTGSTLKGFLLEERVNTTNMVAGAGAGAALAATTDGKDAGNLFIGKDAGASIGTVKHNTIIGYEAGPAVAQGQNTVIGYRAGFTKASGQYCTLIGANAGAACNANTTAIGADSLILATTTGNTGVGYKAGNQQGAGTNNVYVGLESGVSHTGGTASTFIGYQSGVSANGTVQASVAVGGGSKIHKDGTRCIALGNDAKTTTSRQMVIGSATPGATILEVIPGSLTINNPECNLGSTTNGFGTVYCSDIILSDTKVAFGVSAGSLNQGIDTTAVGPYAGGQDQSEKAVAVGYYAGNATQGDRGVAVGPFSGEDSQGNDTVAIGYLAGRTSQGEAAIAIGREAGNASQALNSICIGPGTAATHANSICLGNGATSTATGQFALGGLATVDAGLTHTQTNRMQIKYNGVDYWIPLETV